MFVHVRVQVASVCMHEYKMWMGHCTLRYAGTALTERKTTGVVKLTDSVSLTLFFLAEDQICYSYSYGVRAVVQCIPAWLRFIQCLRRYRDNKRAFHLVNAGKYSTTFFVVTFAALYSTHKGTGYFGKSFIYQSLLLLLFRTPTGRNSGGQLSHFFTKLGRVIAV